MLRAKTIAAALMFASLAATTDALNAGQCSKFTEGEGEMTLCVKETKTVDPKIQARNKSPLYPTCFVLPPHSVSVSSLMNLMMTRRHDDNRTESSSTDNSTRVGGIVSLAFVLASPRW